MDHPMSLASLLRPQRALAAAIVAIAVIVPAAAQEAADDQVVARVNGEAITEADIALAAQDFRETLGQLPPEQRIMGLINGIIDIRLMARAAEAAGLDDDEAAARRLGFIRDRALRAEFLRVNVFEAVTDEAVQARYDAGVAEFVPAEEVRASHILVETEDEAKALIVKLQAGEDFAQLAKDNSVDLGSGANGGDLEYFGRGRMIPPFEEAAFALEPGKYTTEPVQSQFGWHVILVVDKRMSSPPTLEQMMPELRDAVARDLFLSELDKLRAAAEIEFIEAEAEPGADDGAEAPAEPQ
jgi:peptidyl-prolyl cis-trans isomerase C